MSDDDDVIMTEAVNITTTASERAVAKGLNAATGGLDRKVAEIAIVVFRYLNDDEIVVPAGSSSSVPADYVSAGHVLVSADRDRIC
ncbi:hypothetical protein Tco_1332647 [Tanacetum coccineum]